VAHRIAEKVHHGVLQGLKHLPVHLDIETDAAHLHVASGFARDLAHHMAEAAENRLCRHEGYAVNAVAHLACRLLDGPARLPSVAGQGGQPTKQRFQALVEIA
jgi:hypothetical protein